MKTLLKTALITLAVMLPGSSSVFAEQAVRRIDHPNAPSTYALIPGERAPAAGFYVDEFEVTSDPSFIAERELTVRSGPGMTDSEGRPMIPLHRGRGEVIYLPVQP